MSNEKKEVGKLYLKEGISSKTNKPYSMLCAFVVVDGDEYLVPLDSKETFLYRQLKKHIPTNQII